MIGFLTLDGSEPPLWLCMITDILYACKNHQRDTMYTLVL